MKLLMAAGIALLAGSGLCAQDLPQWVLQLSRIKRQAKAEQLRLPNFACVETIRRFQKLPGLRVLKPVDTIRLDVAFVGGKELVAPVDGSSGFREMDMDSLVTGGVIGTGVFSAMARNLFVNDNARTTGWAEERMLERPAIRFDFVIPEMLAGYTVSSLGRSGSVGIEGSFWADAETLELLRIDEHAVDIPSSLDMREASTTVTYARTHIGNTDVRLPQSAVTVMSHNNGWLGRNEIEFSGCREYSANSVIRFDSPDAEPPAKKK